MMDRGDGQQTRMGGAAVVTAVVSMSICIISIFFDVNFM